MKNGVMYIASGQKYVDAALRSAQSVRKHSPSLGLEIFTNDVVENGVFDFVRGIEGAHKRSKVDYIGKSSFERVLYLDTDTIVVDDIMNLFDLLDRFDFAIAHAHARNKTATNEFWRVEIPRSFPQMNGGVVLFKNAGPVQNLLAEWSRAYHEAGFSKDQVTLRELLWLSNLRLYILPPEYNVRYSKYEDIWEPNEATPKILHYAEFHQDVKPPASPFKRARRRIKSMLGR